MAYQILIIDDDPLLSTTTARRLDKRGFKTTVTNTGSEGVELALNDSFDLILLDIKMPDISGNEVLEKIRKTKTKNFLPIIMVSSCEGQEDIINSLTLGANDYISKPINIDILIARINTQLELKLLSLEYAKNNEIEAINAMITTYNHEINNPLTVSFLMLNKIKDKDLLPQEIYWKLEKSLVRVRDIVRKIDTVCSDKKIKYTNYTQNSKMVDLK